MRCVPRQSLGTSDPLLSVLASAGVMIKAFVTLHVVKPEDRIVS